MPPKADSPDTLSTLPSQFGHREHDSRPVPDSCFGGLPGPAVGHPMATQLPEAVEAAIEAMRGKA